MSRHAALRTSLPRKLIALVLCIAASQSIPLPQGFAGELIYRSLPATKAPTIRDVVTLPNYREGQIVAMRVGGRFAYVIKPRGKVDPSKRWVWIFPFEHALASAGGGIEHQFYVDAALAKGFYVAGIDIGVACGSPRAAELCQRFYARLIGTDRLNPRARLLAQSNGGLNAYAWAVRHPDCLECLAGIYPATDLRSWPGLAKALV